jgi:hypothetical protein
MRTRTLTCLAMVDWSGYLLNIGISKVNVCCVYLTTMVLQRDPKTGVMPFDHLIAAFKKKAQWWTAKAAQSDCKASTKKIKQRHAKSMYLNAHITSNVQQAGGYVISYLGVTERSVGRYKASSKEMGGSCSNARHAFLRELAAKHPDKYTHRYGAIVLCAPMFKYRFEKGVGAMFHMDTAIEVQPGSGDVIGHRVRLVQGGHVQRPHYPRTSLWFNIERLGGSEYSEAHRAAGHTMWSDLPPSVFIAAAKIVMNKANRQYRPLIIEHLRVSTGSNICITDKQLETPLYMYIMPIVHVLEGRSDSLTATRTKPAQQSSKRSIALITRKYTLAQQQHMFMMMMEHGWMYEQRLTTLRPKRLPFDRSKKHILDAIQHLLVEYLESHGSKHKAVPISQFNFNDASRLYYQPGVTLKQDKNFDDTSELAKTTVTAYTYAPPKVDAYLRAIVEYWRKYGFDHGSIVQSGSLTSSITKQQLHPLTRTYYRALIADLGERAPPGVTDDIEAFLKNESTSAEPAAAAGDDGSSDAPHATGDDLNDPINVDE